MEAQTFTLELPISKAAGSVTVETEQTVVIVGANGSGKTRLGTWIELDSSQKSGVHRIAAQKSLSMPEVSRTSSTEYAESELLYGAHLPRPGRDPEQYKIAHRWESKPETILLDDYEKLMVLLFTERFEKTNAYYQDSQQSEQKVRLPETRLDTIKRIWELILPHRELEIRAGEIRTHLKDTKNNSYNASEMSDGERVIFYLIGQTLCAPRNGIIVIDEPELHLHKSIQLKLWREIQATRPDCLFVYITHDVEFAASLTEAKKIWLKSFDGQFWEWEEIPVVENFPEELVIQILGSRRPILFVEGDNGSHDVALFRALYPSHTVIPRGSCSQVILSTRALTQSIQFHHLQVRGIVDRDRLNSEQIPQLQRDGIEVLEVAEVENLFCVPEVLKLVAVQQGFPENVKLQEAKAFVFRELARDLKKQVSLHAASEIKFRINAFDIKKLGADALKAELQARLSGVDVDYIYNEVQNSFNEAIRQQNYVRALSLFNRKGLAAQLSGIFAIKQLPDFVLRMMRNSQNSEWIEAFSKYVPNLNS